MPLAECDLRNLKEKAVPEMALRRTDTVPMSVRRFSTRPSLVSFVKPVLSFAKSFANKPVTADPRMLVALSSLGK